MFKQDQVASFRRNNIEALASLRIVEEKIRTAPSGELTAPREIKAPITHSDNTKELSRKLAVT